jgi:hypothetical protein
VLSVDDFFAILSLSKKIVRGTIQICVFFENERNKSMMMRMRGGGLRLLFHLQRD